MGELLKNLIDGKWADSANGTTFDDINPANKAEAMGTIPRSDHRDVDRAVESARTHFVDWSRVSAIQRGDFLYRAAAILHERADGLANAIVLETGKRLAEAHMEVHDGVSVLRAIASEGSRLRGAALPFQRPEAFAIAVPVPMGVVAVITHWSFPLVGCVWTLASALTAGNTVVLKPAEDAPLVATRLAEIFLDAGLPLGTISLVHGYGEEAGAPLVRHPDVALVSFTGSPDVGREVGITCAAEQKRFSLDMGERCVVFVLEDADLEVAVEGVVGEGFATSGQRWRGAVRVFVHRRVMKEFSERLVARVQTLTLGDGISAATDIGPIINDAQLKRVHGRTRIGLRDGARLLCGGEVVRDGDCRRGFYYAPTVFGDATPKMRSVQDDIRGPMVALLTVTGLEEAIDQANVVSHDMAAAVFTRDLTKALRISEGVGAARTHVNPVPSEPGKPLPLSAFSRCSRVRRDAVLQNLNDFGAWKEVTIDSARTRP